MVLKMKKFTMIDEEFICENCGSLVNGANYTARDHCPNCLYSKHMDIYPGDRLETCHGLLRPIGIETDPKNDYNILYRCEKCYKRIKNRVARDDNMDEIIKISVNKD